MVFELSLSVRARGGRADFDWPLVEDAPGSSLESRSRAMIDGGGRLCVLTCREVAVVSPLDSGCPLAIEGEDRIVCRVQRVKRGTKSRQSCIEDGQTRKLQGWLDVCWMRYRLAGVSLLRGSPHATRQTRTACEDNSVRARARNVLEVNWVIVGVVRCTRADWLLN